MMGVCVGIGVCGDGCVYRDMVVCVCGYGCVCVRAHVSVCICSSSLLAGDEI